jgi:hypothetical protein
MPFWLPTPRFAAFLAAAAGISLTASERAPSAEFRALTPPQVTLGRVVEGPRVDACELRRRAVALEPALPGAPGVEAARGERGRKLQLTHTCLARMRRSAACASSS